MNTQTKREYNLLGVIRSMCGGSAQGEDIGLATEISKEMRLRDKTGNLNAREGFILPDMKLLRDMGLARDEVPPFGTGAAMGGGGNAVSTDVMLGQFITALTAKTSFGKAGITKLEGLVGDVAIPKCTQDVNAAWISAENGDATHTVPTLGQVVMTPHTLGAYVDITRKMIVQTSRWAERIVIQLLQDAVARAVETAIFNGSGSDGVPLGILGMSGIQEVALKAGAVTHGDLLGFISKLETENVDVADGCAWIGSPAVKKMLAETIDLTAVKNVEGKDNVGGVATKYLYADGKVEDYPFITTGLVPAKKLIFAKWSDVVLGSWSGVSILVDQYTLARSGGVRVVVLSDWDVAVRHAKSIAVGNALS